jgi:hypothetical protein
MDRAGFLSETHSVADPSQSTRVPSNLPSGFQFGAELQKRYLRGIVSLEFFVSNDRLLPLAAIYMVEQR